VSISVAQSNNSQPKRDLRH